MVGHGRAGRVGPITRAPKHGEVSQEGCSGLAYIPHSTKDTVVQAVPARAGPARPS